MPAEIKLAFVIYNSDSHTVQKSMPPKHVTIELLIFCEAHAYIECISVNRHGHFMPVRRESAGGGVDSQSLSTFDVQPQRFAMLSRKNTFGCARV
jgi:hypothetical protein